MNTINLYAYPHFVRTSGLGNRLFPWARADLYCREHGAEMLAPAWVSLRRGPLFRSGRVTGGVPAVVLGGKIYLIGNFKPSSMRDQLVRAWALSHGVKIAEDEKPVKLDYSCNRSKVVIFKGDAAHFRNLAGESDYLLSRLRSIAIPSLVASVDRLSVPPIVINVRLGRDFREAKAEEDYHTKGAIRTPVTWFREVLDDLRRLAGTPIPAIVVSDGSDSDLTELLELEHVIRARTRTAIEDLLILSKAHLIIGSGGSSFTAWGAFLAQSDIITIPGQSMAWFGLEECSKGRVITWRKGERPLPLNPATLAFDRVIND